MKARTIAEYRAMQERKNQAMQRMAELRRRVLAHLETEFTFCEGLTTLPDLDYGNGFKVYSCGVEMQACSLFPGGVLLTDRNGNQVLFYWDILTGKVQSA
ncbi:hypothetical protein [Paenibacillus dendritiformis]|uniref:hypothetical protein n=1 Tax=Paenibacillus dendritiformis TaxID=130049 RepID=UPI000DA75B5A|nr:hypothetical protein [Paenibacillus dendritiformis]PZM65691.1 hypothetical protein DOE73_10285 [Paenibacillus dendritiformis]